MRSLRLVACLAIPAQIALGQQTPTVPVTSGTGLSLEQAISTARQNNPLLLQTQNQVRIADAQVRSAYGALLPSLNASMATNYTESGTQYVQGVPFASGANAYSGDYRIGVGYTLSSSVLFAPRAARANRAASEATAASTSETLRANVTTQYITALQAKATAAVNDTLVQSAQGSLDLANAKMKVGAGTILDVRTAEVAVGQAEVNAVQAHNQADIEKLKLFQQMGVPADSTVVLTTTFSVTAPPASLDSLLQLARLVNPDLAARKSTQYADQMQLRVAQTQYLPRLSVSTGIGGNSFAFAESSDILVQEAEATALGRMGSCLSNDSLRVGAGLSPRGGCGTGTIPQSQADLIRATNNPFRFQRAPFSISAQLSLPIFDNFQREQQVEQAQVARDNAAYDVRSRNLQLVTDVTTAYLNLVTARKTVDLQETNARQATEALAFAEESYKVGAKTFLDVTTARGTYQKALVDRINAIYEYHKAFAALEGAVGRPLR
jgi:outer membrane protein